MRSARRHKELFFIRFSSATQEKAIKINFSLDENKRREKYRNNKFIG